MLHLKSGSDIRGIAIDDKNPAQIDLTDDVVKRIVIGFIKFLSEQYGAKIEDLKISIGHDSRLSANRIKSAIISAANPMVMRIFDCGLSSTPAMFRSINHLDCHGAIMITASHHPANRNGLKFFTARGGISSGDIDAILSLAKSAEILPEIECGNVEKVDFITVYAASLRKIICDKLCSDDGENPLKDLRITVDAGGGAGGFFAREVLAKLGADTSSSVLLEPDGTFSVHVPNPEEKAAVEYLKTAVLSAKSDFGVIFDTDVDRSGFVDASGAEINKSALVALVAAIVIEKNPDATIVTDSATNADMTRFIESLGGRHRRFKRGYANVINEAKRLNSTGENAILAIETSGHAAFKDNDFLDDGAYLACLIIAKMVEMKRKGESLLDLIKDFKLPKSEAEKRIKITRSDFKIYGETVIETFKDHLKKQGYKQAHDDCEGARMLHLSGNHFISLRLSVHDPVLIANVESYDENASENMKNLQEFFEKFDELTL